MQNYFIGVALIREFVEDKGYWLGCWDEDLQHFDFVTAERIEQESFREIIVREVGWRLGLDRDKDYLVSNIAQISTQFVGWLPGQTKEQNVAVSFFPVHLYGKLARSKIENAADTRWLKANEICAGQTDDGKQVDPRLVDLIKRTRVVQHWESD